VHATPSRKLPSIRAKIAMLVATCALPTLLGFGALTWHFYTRERNLVIADARQTARALAAAVDRDLDNGETAAFALAASPALVRGDLEGFHAEARRILRPQFPGYAFMLTDAAGRQLVNTETEAGRPLPLRTDPAQSSAVFNTGKAVVSNLVHDRNSGTAEILIDVPVWRDGRIAYSLGVALRARRLGELLTEQQLPSHMVATIIDANGIVVARTRDSDKYSGTSSRPELLAKMREESGGTVAFTSFEGTPSYANFSRSLRSGWTVAVLLPREYVASAVLDSVKGILSLVALTLAAGFLLAWRMGGRISRSVKNLMTPAGALAGLNALPVPEVDFREAQQVALVLGNLTSQVMRQRQHLEALVAERTAALEKSNGLLQSVYATAPVGLCLLDPDLRIMAINDSLAAWFMPAAAESPQPGPGQRLATLVGQLGEEIEQLYGRVFENGQALADIELSGVVPGAPFEMRYWLVSCYPAWAPGGSIAAVNGVLIDITERKRLDTRLRDNEEHFRVLYESARDANVLATMNAGFVGANQAAAALFGCRDIPELLQLSPLTSSPEFQPDGSHSASKAQAMMRAALEQGGVSFEWLHQRPDGSQFYAEVSLNSLDIGGKGIFQATIRDVTPRKLTEMALRQSEMMLTSIVESMPAMIYVKRVPDMRYEIVNRFGEKMLGLPRGAFLGKTDEELLPPEIAQQYRLVDQQVLASNTVWEEERAEVLTGSGEERILTARTVALRDQAGNPTHILGVAIDVTERRRAEDALRIASRQLQQSERFVLTITDNLPGMVAYWDRDQRCRFVNRRYRDWYRRFSGSARELNGIGMAEMFGPAAYAAAQPYVLGVLQGKPQSYARELPDADGGTIYFWADYIPDVGTDGEVRGFYALLADVSTLKRTELRLSELNEELVRARDRAEAASSAKSEFVANMSHEIRTPMNAIIGLARLLEEAPLERRERSYVAKIKLATQSLLALLNDVLDFSRIEAGQLALEQAPFVLDQVLTSTAVLATGNAWAKGVEPVFAVAPDVPLALVGDAMRLQQVLLNLIGNAVKFTERGEIVLSIQKVDQQDGSVMLEFSVRDTGIGIAFDQQRTMFDAFSQADTSTSRKYGGAGLGLAICRRLVALMGGAIAVHSVPGEGSNFRFTSVFGIAPDARAAHAVANASSLAAPENLRDLSILVVDDNATVRTVLREACAALGWHAETAGDCAAALRLMQDHARQFRDFDLLLLDSAMPGMDGIATLMQARATPRLAVPPVIMMVADAASENLAQIADTLRIDGVLTKPATPPRLLAAVAAALSGSSVSLSVPLPSPLSGRLGGMAILLVEDNEINQEVAQYILLHAGARVEIATNGQLALDMLQAPGAAYDIVLMDIQMPVLYGFEAARGDGPRCRSWRLHQRCWTTIAAAQPTPA
jgi:PAS domain S-box-containing protein